MTSSEGKIQCLICQRSAQHEQVREQVTRNQKRAATQMLESARKKLKIAAVGDNVRIPIPLYDRAKGDQRNLLGLITDVDENGLFTITTKHGLLSSKFSRNQFEINDRKVLTPSDIPDENRDKQMSVRETAIASSLGHGQGYAKCNCNGPCTSNRCKCRKDRLLCNSHCHPRNAKCKNKHV